MRAVLATIKSIYRLRSAREVESGAGSTCEGPHRALSSWRSAHWGPIRQRNMRGAFGCSFGGVALSSDRHANVRGRCACSVPPVSRGAPDRCVAPGGGFRSTRACVRVSFELNELARGGRLRCRSSEARGGSPPPASGAPRLVSFSVALVRRCGRRCGFFLTVDGAPTPWRSDRRPPRGASPPALPTPPPGPFGSAAGWAVVCCYIGAGILSRFSFYHNERVYVPGRPIHRPRARAGEVVWSLVGFYLPPPIRIAHGRNSAPAAVPEQMPR